MYKVSLRQALWLHVMHFTVCYVFGCRVDWFGACNRCGAGTE